MNKSYTLLIIFFISLTNVFAQDKDQVKLNLENLSKTWVISGIINPDKTEEDLNETLSLLEGTSLVLNSDFSCVFNFILEQSGTWELNDNIIIVNTQRGKNNWIIHGLKKNEVILSRNEGKQKLVFKTVN
jgi:hypothetical protein